MTVFLSKRGLKKNLTFFIECKIPVEGNLKKIYLYMSTLNQWSPFADDFQIDLICLFANCIFQTWAFCKFTNERMNVVNERGKGEGGLAIYFRAWTPSKCRWTRIYLFNFSNKQWHFFPRALDNDEY